jgi:hypothetical protein
VTLSPSIRRLTLTIHVAVSVGWIGAVAAFLVLSVAGLVNQEAQVIRSAFMAMDLVGRYLIGARPLCLAGRTAEWTEG